jgi:hypothetical protein
MEFNVTLLILHIGYSSWISFPPAFSLFLLQVFPTASSRSQMNTLIT